MKLRVALLLVCLQVPYPCEPSATQPTAVWFFPGVNSLVLPQVPSLGERLPACGAAERLLPRVDTLVDLHLLWAVESFTTVAADEQSFLGAGSMLCGAAVAAGLGQ